MLGLGHRPSNKLIIERAYLFIVTIHNIYLLLLLLLHNYTVMNVVLLLLLLLLLYCYFIIMNSDISGTHCVTFKDVEADLHALIVLRAVDGAVFVASSASLLPDAPLTARFTDTEGKLHLNERLVHNHIWNVVSAYLLQSADISTLANRVINCACCCCSLPGDDARTKHRSANVLCEQVVALLLAMRRPFDKFMTWQITQRA
jgi:hypothetical protein